MIHGQCGDPGGRRPFDPRCIPGLAAWWKATPTEDGGHALVDVLTGMVVRDSNRFGEGDPPTIVELPGRRRDDDPDAWPLGGGRP